MTIDNLINDFAIAIKDLRQSHDKLDQLNIYVNPETVDLIITNFIGQYDLLLNDQQCDYLRCL